MVCCEAVLVTSASITNVPPAQTSFPVENQSVHTHSRSLHHIKLILDNPLSLDVLDHNQEFLKASNQNVVKIGMEKVSTCPRKQMLEPART